MKQKNELKKIIAFIIIILLTIQTTSFADDNTNENESQHESAIELNLNSKSCILIECSTNRVAYEKNADQVMYPASTTKLLTAILAIENCELTDTVTITNKMISQVPNGYTSAYLVPGEILTIEQLLNCLLIPSANDAGFALAIHISGSIENFANLMNEKALQIGCTNSHFTNPSGIHDDNHYSTAKDMALIGLYALKYPKISEICSQTTYTLSAQNGSTQNESAQSGITQNEFTQNGFAQNGSAQSTTAQSINIKTTRNFNTTNTLLKKDETSYYEYATGLKTGFTSPAGSCIVATATKDNMNFIAVVLGASPPINGINYRDIDCKTLFEYGFTNYDDIVKLVPLELTSNFSNLIKSGNIFKYVFRTSLVIFTILLFYCISRNKNKNINDTKQIDYYYEN